MNDFSISFFIWVVKNRHLKFFNQPLSSYTCTIKKISLIELPLVNFPFLANKENFDEWLKFFLPYLSRTRYFECVFVETEQKSFHLYPVTIENNDQVQPHFAQLHVTQNFWSYCKGLMPKLFFICMPRCAKVRFWRFLDFYTMKINLWSKFDNFASL